MNKNVGKIDKILRYIFGVLVLVLFFTGQIRGALAVLLILVAIILIVTGLISWCGIYKLLGISTIKKK